jgi:hypothetical protein
MSGDELAELEVGDAVGGVDDDLGDLLGGVVGDLLDFDTALGGGDDDGAGGGAVEEDGEVIFFFDVARDGEVDGLHLAAGGAGLDGDEGVAEHLGGDGLGVGLGFAELHAALVAVGKGALAAAAGVDLGFDHGGTFGEGGEGGIELLGGLGGGSLGNGNPVFLEQCLGLILVDIHAKGLKVLGGGGLGTPKKKHGCVMLARMRPALLDANGWGRVRRCNRTSCLKTSSKTPAPSRFRPTWVCRFR